jgi:hypothetical protein
VIIFGILDLSAIKSYLLLPNIEMGSKNSRISIPRVITPKSGVLTPFY